MPKPNPQEKPPLSLPLFSSSFLFLFSLPLFSSSFLFLLLYSKLENLKARDGARDRSSASKTSRLFTEFFSGDRLRTDMRMCTIRSAIIMAKMLLKWMRSLL